MNSKLKTEIVKIIAARGQEIISFLQRLVEFNSETGHESAIQDFIATTLDEMGLIVDKWEFTSKELEGHPAYIPVENMDFSGRPNVVGIYRGTENGKSILLNGHVDTVPTGPLSKWNYSPYSGIVKQGKTYGRGTSDMKSGLAAMIMAVKILLDTGLEPKGSIILQFVIDEEVTGYGTLSCILRGYKADAGICCETSDLCVQPACIGRLWFTIEVPGKSVSITKRYESVNVIQKGYKIAQAVDDLEKIRIKDLKHPLYSDNREALPCGVCMFNSGVHPSIIPDKAVLRGSMGLFPHESVKKVKEQFMAHIKSIIRTDPWLKNNPPEITFKDVGGDGAEISPSHPIVNILKKAFEDATGKPAVINGRTGGADTRYLIKYGMTPTVIFGPGVTSQMHATNEYVPVKNLITAVKVLVLTIYEWCR